MSAAKHDLSAHQIALLLDAMLAAGRVILEVRDAGLGTRQKDDGSPVTLADERAEAILLAALAHAAPDIPVIAEEAVEAGHIPQTGEAFFLVDPLDGTKEFIRGGEDFTVNIGLIHKKRPVFGLIYAPASGRLFGGQVQNGAWQGRIDCRLCETVKGLSRTSMQVRQPDQHKLMAVASHSHRAAQTDDWLKDHHIKTTISAGSSLKFCLVAAGEADVYPRHWPTMEWDTAAGQAILEAAGGRVETLAGNPFLYGKKDQEKPWLNPGFIAYGG